MNARFSFRQFAVTALMVCALLPSRPAKADDDVDFVNESLIARITLPAGTLRMNDAGTIQKMILPLSEVGKEFKNTVGEHEVLAWADPKKRATKVKAEVLDKLKTAGYETSELGEAVPTEAGNLRFFAARKEQPRTVLLAYWVDNKDALILTWALMNKAEGATPETKPVPNPLKPAPAKPEPPKPSPAANPGSLQGAWGFTTISGTTYWDRSTGAYLGSGTGGSQTYTILPNGRYKMFNYIRSRMYSWETQALTWEDGNVTISGNKIKFTPTSGKYQVIDNQSSSRNYTRPMTDAEIAKNVKESYWRLDAKDGKRVLIMSKTPNEGEVTYKRVEE